MILTENNVYEMLMDLKDILNAVQNIAEQYYQENKSLEQEIQKQKEILATQSEKYKQQMEHEENKYKELQGQYRQEKEAINEKLQCLVDIKRRLEEKEKKLDHEKSLYDDKNKELEGARIKLDN